MRCVTFLQKLKHKTIMAYSVNLLPTGQKFITEPHESVLDAAIRAGIPLQYGCSNGKCGLCKARVVKGEVVQLRYHDYALSAAEKKQKCVLMCASAAASNLLVEAQVDTSVEDIGIQQLRVKVRKLQRMSRDLLIMHVRMPRSERFKFLAGQSLTLKIAGVGEFDYSIASCPCDDRQMEFHIRHMDSEPVSDFIFKHLKSGDWLELKGPKGRFVLREGSRRPMIMIAFDTGFAAIKSLLEQATAQEQEREIFLYWITCGAEDPYLHNLCRAWEDALDEFHYFPLSIPRTYEEILDQYDRQRKTIERQLSEVVDQHPDLSAFDLYIAAPEPFIESAQKLFLHAGLDPARFSVEILQDNLNVNCLAHRL